MSAAPRVIRLLIADDEHLIRGALSALLSLEADIEVRRVLALVVREATTNILRHSSASRAAITLATSADGSTLEVVNNAASPATDAAGRAPSSGLTGLRDRVAAIGGHLHADSDGDTFVLRAFVAVRAGVDA